MTVTTDTDLQVNWYDAANGGTLLVSNTLSFTPTTAGIYYAESLDPNTNCTSTTRTAVTLTVNDLPTYVETIKECSADLSTYFVSFSTTGNEVVNSLGTVINNGDGTFTISDVPANTDISLTISNTTTDCGMLIELTAPDCDCPTINAPTISTLCDDNNTPNNPTDDTFTYQILTTSSISGTYNIAGDDMQTGLLYGEISPVFGPLTISDGELIIQIVDVNSNGACTLDDLMITPPIACSSCEETANAGANQVFNCNTTELQLNGTASALGIFNWETPSGEEITNNPSPTVDEIGIYTLIVLFENGCMVETTTEITLGTLSPVADAGLDTELSCAETSVLLGGENTTPTGVSFLWQNAEGETVAETETFTTDQPGVFTFTVTDNITNCTSSDAVTVTVIDLELQALIVAADAIDCYSTSVELVGENTTGEDNIQFTWTTMTGEMLSTNNTLETSEPGMYIFTVIDVVYGCTSADTTEVLDITSYPLTDAGVDMVLDCNDGTAILDGSNSQFGVNIIYQWSDTDGNVFVDEIGDTLFVTEPNLYILTLTDTINGCTGTDEVLVSDLSTLTAENDILSLQMNETKELDLTANDDLSVDNAYIFMLNNVPTIGTSTLSETGVLTFVPDTDFIGNLDFSYTVCYMECPDLCAEATIQIIVTEGTVFVPDVFSPNGDGLNDTWIIPGLEEYEKNRLTVVNRWGTVLFEASPYLSDWDGNNKKGRPLPEGTYYYLLFTDVAEEVPVKGAISIVR